MKERPILFNTQMVQAILDGRKTQTRRIVKGIAMEWIKAGFTLEFVSNSDNYICPFGKIGDVLWVRETWQNEAEEIQISGGDWSNAYLSATGNYVYKADGICLPEDSVAFGKWKPSIHMPRKACRLFLEITDIRVERLQDISVEDAIAEGIIHKSMNCPKVEFQQLWQTVYGNESWESNPFVWVVKFKQVEK